LTVLMKMFLAAGLIALPGSKQLLCALYMVYMGGFSGTRMTIVLQELTDNFRWKVYSMAIYNSTIAGTCYVFGAPGMCITLVYFGFFNKAIAPRLWSKKLLKNLGKKKEMERNMFKERQSTLNRVQNHLLRPELRVGKKKKQAKSWDKLRGDLDSMSMHARNSLLCTAIGKQERKVAGPDGKVTTKKFIPKASVRKTFPMITDNMLNDMMTKYGDGDYIEQEVFIKHYQPVLEPMNMYLDNFLKGEYEKLEKQRIAQEAKERQYAKMNSTQLSEMQAARNSGCPLGFAASYADVVRRDHRQE